MKINPATLEQALAKTDVMHCCVCEENDNLDEYRGEALQIADLVEQGETFDVAIKVTFKKSFEFSDELSDEQINKIIDAYHNINSNY